SWRQIKQRGMWPGGRYGHSAWTMGGKLYIAGGWKENSFSTDCWCFCPDTETWTQQDSAPSQIGFSSTVVVGDTAHVFCGSPAQTTHLTFSVSGGWHTEATIPFSVFGAGAVCMGTDIHVMGGNFHETNVHVYNTHSKGWRKTGNLPVSPGDSRACCISPDTVLLHHKGETVVGEDQRQKREAEAEKEKEREAKAQAEREAEAERERETAVSHLIALGVSAEDIPPGPISLADVVSQIVTCMTTSSKAFDAFTPDALPALQSLIDRARSFDLSALSTHILCLKQCVPVARGLSPSLSALRQFLKEHKREELVSEECPPLLVSLSELHSAYTPYHSALSHLDFDTAESLAFLQSASDLLDSINTTSLIPLPKDHASLSLGDKGKYFQAESFNSGVRELYAAALDIINSQRDIEACMLGLRDLDPPDTTLCDEVDTQAKGVLQMLEYLAPRQTESRALVSEYKALPTVSDTDI
ncbi:hypothetical protein KIPB_011551, partial [Kipferlia bialata]